MTKVKPSSTRNQNKTESALACPITYVMNKVGGHWKAIILYSLMNGPMRYSELKRAIPGITEKMLAQHLKEMAADGLLQKDVLQPMPPVTLYTLSESGERLVPVLLAMADWAMKDNDQFRALMETMISTYTPHIPLPRKSVLAVG